MVLFYSFLKQKLLGNQHFVVEVDQGLLFVCKIYRKTPYNNTIVQLKQSLNLVF